MFPSTTDQFYYNNQYDTSSRPVLNYSEYTTNDYNSRLMIFNFDIFLIVYLSIVPEDYIPYQPITPFIYPQGQINNTIKIHVNPFFRPRLSNPTSESSSGIEKDGSSSIEEQHSSSFSSRSRSRSRSPVPNRQLPLSVESKREVRQFRKAQRQKFLEAKQLMFERQSSLISKPKHRHSTPKRWERKDEELHRLYKEYSSEDTSKQWNPLVIKQCFELYRYAFDKYHKTSLDDPN